MPNLTIKIDDEEIIRRAKVMAAKRGTSVSAMLRAYLYDLVSRDKDYERSQKQAFLTMKRGLHLGGAPLSREEIYDDSLG